MAIEYLLPWFAANSISLPPINLREQECKTRNILSSPISGNFEKFNFTGIEWTPVLDSEVNRILVLRLKSCHHVMHVPPNLVGVELENKLKLEFHLLDHPPVWAAVLKLGNGDNQLSSLHAEKE